MQFSESLAYLLSLGHETLTIKLGLENTRIVLEALGNPHHSFKSVQIAGTNGKGSTAVMLESIARQAGISTGLFTSPHLISITERIKFAGVEISPEDFAKHATQVKSTVEKLVAEAKLQTPPTFFEHVTAIAFLAFKTAGLELAVLETGLGGRLDATTVAGAEVVGITSIALDHQEYLGATIQEIAAEKAAIIHPGSLAVIAPQQPAALNVILARAAECKVDPRLVGDEAVIEKTTTDGRFTVTFQTNCDRYESTTINLRGRHQIENAATAIGLAEALRQKGWDISRADIIRGIETAEHAGRLELIGRCLLDGAHNPAAATVLHSYLDEFVSGPLTLVFGAMKDKNLEEIAAILFPAATHLVLTQPDNARSASVEELLRIASAIDAPNVFVTRSVREAIAKADAVTSASGVICITGSLYLVGEAQAVLKSSKT